MLPALAVETINDMPLITLETPAQYELRTMPEVAGPVPTAPAHRKQTNSEWHREQRRLHDERWENDPEYRQDWMEREAEYQRTRNIYHDTK
jgi:hypothetical protein